MLITNFSGPSKLLRYIRNSLYPYNEISLYVLEYNVFFAIVEYPIIYKKIALLKMYKKNYDNTN